MTAPHPLVVDRAELPGPLVEVRLRLPSYVQHVEAAVEVLARHCFAGTEPARRTAFRFRVAVAEALANAIICGNGEDPALHVTVLAECGPDQLRVHVSDEGDGFDPCEVPEPIGPAELDRAGGRGLFLIRNLADQVEFTPRGNSLCMTFRLP